MSASAIFFHLRLGPALHSANHFDVVVAGIGAMGSAAIDHLSRRGARVLGLERFSIPNALGSSHGHTRIIRKAYFESPLYVPLLERSYTLWHELEQDAGRALMVTTGSLDIGAAGSRVYRGSLASCHAHGLEHEQLTAAELQRRFPAWTVPDTFLAVYQPDGGFLLPEECITAHVARAHRHGAAVHERETVMRWRRDGNGVNVTTDHGAYSAGHLILCAGPWNAALSGQLGAYMVPERQALVWFEPLVQPAFQAGRFPVYICQIGQRTFYGFPEHDRAGTKIGLFRHLREAVDPDAMDRECHPADEAPLRDFVATYLPGGAGRTLDRKTCLFTNTPDEHFIIDQHPDSDRVTVAGGFSGHGFKFATVIGEILADLALDGRTGHDTSLFGASRFLPVNPGR